MDRCGVCQSLLKLRCKVQDRLVCLECTSMYFHGDDNNTAEPQDALNNFIRLMLQALSPGLERLETRQNEALRLAREY